MAYCSMLQVTGVVVTDCRRSRQVGQPKGATEAGGAGGKGYLERFFLFPSLSLVPATSFWGRAWLAEKAEERQITVLFLIV
jgi:hypothetical protein